MKAKETIGFILCFIGCGACGDSKGLGLVAAVIMVIVGGILLYSSNLQEKREKARKRYRSYK